MTFRLNQSCLISIGILLLSHNIIFADLARAYPGERAPEDSLEALCRHGGGRPTYCKVKIDRSKNTFQIWTPPGIQGAMLHTFTTRCFKKDCLITGPDFGYIQGPEKYKIIEISNKKLKFVSLGDALNAPIEQEVRILD